MQQRQQASPAGKGSPSELAREGGWKRAPAAVLIASYRLWSSPPPAEPRCFPPSSHSSLGTRGAGAGLGSQPAQGCLAMGLAPERPRRSARGRPPRWERERRRQRRRLQGARSGVQVRAEAGGGRRGRCAALGGGGARAAGWKREPPTESPGARRPSPLPLRAPPLPPAAESPDGGGGRGAGAGALDTE